jgi:hypothetical protein
MNRIKLMDRHGPTLPGMVFGWAVAIACVWVEWRDAVRARRRERECDARYALVHQPTWRDDWLLLAVAAISLVACAALVAWNLSDAWPGVR